MTTSFFYIPLFPRYPSFFFSAFVFRFQSPLLWGRGGARRSNGHDAHMGFYLIIRAMALVGSHLPVK